MNRISITALFILLSMNNFSQDTVRLYLDASFQNVEMKKALMLRKAVIKKDHYVIIDQYIDGRVINYGEFSSINPFVEDGLSRHYNSGSPYSEGNYKNGIITGEWIYYNIGNQLDTIDYSTVEYFYKNLKDSCKVNSVKDTLLTEEKRRIKENILYYIDQNLHFPARVRDEKEDFNFNVSFTLDTAGIIRCPEIVNLNNVDFTYEILRLLFLYKNGFKILNPLYLSIPIYHNQEPSFVFVEEQATFQGGDINSFRDWVQKNLVYPQAAIEKHVFGRVTVQFAVTSKGDVTDVKILRGVEPSLDKEAYRVIISSPKWGPAIQRKQAVRQQFVIPVIFNPN